MKILVPVDGSAPSLDAVRHALWLVRQGLRTELLLANVQPSASLYEIVLAHDPDVIQHVSNNAGDHLLEPARELCRAAGVPFECEVLSGDPLRAVCELAEQRGCGHIVVGAHGRSALAGALLGSFSQALAHAAPVPVTIVRAGERLAVRASAADATQPQPDELRPH